MLRVAVLRLCLFADVLIAVIMQFVMEHGLLLLADISSAYPGSFSFVCCCKEINMKSFGSGFCLGCNSDAGHALICCFVVAVCSASGESDACSMGSCFAFCSNKQTVHHVFRSQTTWNG